LREIEKGWRLGENNQLVLVESIKEVDPDVDPYVTQQPYPTTSRAIDYVILGTSDETGWMVA